MSRLNQYVLIGIFFLFFPYQASAQFVNTLLPVNQEQPSGTVDIIVEADTYVPAQYNGRAEPSRGSSVRFIAITDKTAPASLHYSWTIDGVTVDRDSNVLSITAPVLRDQFRVGVRVVASGKLYAERNDTVSLTNPELVLYEDNLLQGPSSIAIGDHFTLVGEDTVIKASPYFIKTTDQPEMIANWSINDVKAPYADGDWSRLPISKNIGSGSALISLELIHKTDFLQGLRTSFTLDSGI